ncbi:MAG: deoxyribonuclease V [Deltaproteobacteria bacterium]|nr:deoxyribonuclease V [Deltaproteobacteria bacterium]
MKINHLHRWNCNYQEAVVIQNALRNKLILQDQDLPMPIRTIAGADISYAKGSNIFFAAAILLDYQSMSVIEDCTHIVESTFPYVPGFLSFREGPALLAAFAKLRNKPDAVMFDGQGIAHPRGIGLASHMGLFLDIPAIGCAKTRLCGTHETVENEKGRFTLLHFNNSVCGAVVKTKHNVKPVFISQGHKISLPSAIDIALSCCRGYRLPEPVRKAHLLVNKIRMNYFKTDAD